MTVPLYNITKVCTILGASRQKSGYPFRNPHNFERRYNDLIFCLSHILTDFRPLFNRQSFDLFFTFILGLITHRHRATITGIYQAVRPKTGYNSLVKFLSCSTWDADKVAQHLIMVNSIIT